MNRSVFSVETIKSLIEIDLKFYAEIHNDLEKFSENELYEHYANYGYAEGRACHELSIRENFIKTCKDLKCLEIGPFANPLLKHDNVKYLDILSTIDLQERAERIGLPKNNIPNIDFVSKDGSLSLVKEKFDIVFSSHNLEHQPDIINHLNEVSEILVKDGIYKMIIPNCAYCFDANLPPSQISEIILANKLKLKKHTLAKVIEHRALTVHNDSLAHWKDGMKNAKVYLKLDASRISAAINEYENAKGSYIDVHAWQFLPHTLSDILQTLISLKFIAFNSVRCFGPVYSRNEFCIELIK